MAFMLDKCFCLDCFILVYMIFIKKNSHDQICHLVPEFNSMQKLESIEINISCWVGNTIALFKGIQ